MHCLYNLFRATNLEYYKDEARYAKEQSEDWHRRLDHCIDVLRQKIEWLVNTYVLL